LYWLRISTRHPIGEDFYIYFNAFLKAINSGNPYVPYNIGSGFINHPFLLSVISVLTTRQHDPVITNIIWAILSFIAWLLALIVNLQVIENKNTRIYLFFLLLFTFGPFYEMLYIGQVNAFVVLLISLVFYFREKEWVMGILLAFAIVLKTSPMILFAFLVVSKRWKAIVSCSVSLLVLSLIPFIQFHNGIMTQFLTSISQVGFEIAAGSYNESIVSIIYSIFTRIDVVNSPELLTRIITSGSMIAIVGALCFVHFFKDNNEFEYLLFICLNLVMVIFSPLVWYHHFVFLIIPIIGLYVYPLQKNKVTLLIGSVLFMIQIQRVVEIYRKPGFPTILVSVFMIAYFLLLYFSKNKIEIKDIKQKIFPEKQSKNMPEIIP
jgi:hypothetical protein